MICTFIVRPPNPENTRSIARFHFFSAGLETSLDLEKGEYINMFEGKGVSCKYTIEQIQTLVEKGKQRLCKVWMDSKQYVAVCCIGTIGMEIFRQKKP